jgi:hypothetical protein
MQLTKTEIHEKENNGCYFCVFRPFRGELWLSR